MHVLFSVGDCCCFVFYPGPYIAGEGGGGQGGSCPRQEN